MASSSDWGWLLKVPVISRIIMLMSLCSVCERPLGFQKCPLSAVYLTPLGGEELQTGSKYEVHTGGHPANFLPYPPETHSQPGRDVLPLGSGDLLESSMGLSLPMSRRAAQPAVAKLPDPRLYL